MAIISEVVDDAPAVRPRKRGPAKASLNHATATCTTSSSSYASSCASSCSSSSSQPSDTEAAPSARRPLLRHPTPAPRATFAEILATLGFGVLFVVALLATTSYVVTDSLTFGYSVPHWRKLVPPALRQDLVLTPEQLAQYDGTDPAKPIYLAVGGAVYDVTEGRRFYGPGGAYAFFAGRDATRAYITGCFATHLTHDVRGLDADEVAQGLKQWQDFYGSHARYLRVGRVVLPPIAPDAPVPEPCDAPKR